MIPDLSNSITTEGVYNLKGDMIKYHVTNSDITLTLRGQPKCKTWHKRLIDGCVVRMKLDKSIWDVWDYPYIGGWILMNPDYDVSIEGNTNAKAIHFNSKSLGWICVAIGLNKVGYQDNPTGFIEAHAFDPESKFVIYTNRERYYQFSLDFPVLRIPLDITEVYVE